MAHVLHIAPSFIALRKSLEELTGETERIAEQSKKHGGPSEPITLTMAERLFAQKDYEFRPQFFARAKENGGAAPELLDFKTDAAVTVYEVRGAREMAEPIEVKVDRPFVYAIQHLPSGICLFICRVTDPR